MNEHSNSQFDFSEFEKMSREIASVQKAITDNVKELQKQIPDSALQLFLNPNLEELIQEKLARIHRRKLQRSVYVEAVTDIIKSLEERIRSFDSWAIGIHPEIDTYREMLLSIKNHYEITLEVTKELVDHENFESDAVDNFQKLLNRINIPKKIRNLLRLRR